MYLASSRDPKASTQPIFSILSWRFYYFVHLIQQYTKRDLSFDADSIRGVTGAFRFWQRGNILPFTFSDCFTSHRRIPHYGGPVGYDGHGVVPCGWRGAPSESRLSKLDLGRLGRPRSLDRLRLSRIKV